MKPDVDYVRGRFQAFNELIFASELPDIPIIISKSKSFLGRLEYKRRKRIFAAREIYDIKMRVSARVDMPESDVDDTIIHEMIHLYILVKGLKDSSTHGKVFRAMASDINKRFGYKVSVSHRFTAEQRQELIDSSRFKLRVVARLIMADGRCAVKVIPSNTQSLYRFDRALRLWSAVKSVDYFETSDPYFSAFPCSSALRVQIVDGIELDKHLSDAAPLQI